MCCWQMEHGTQMHDMHIEEQGSSTMENFCTMLRRFIQLPSSIAGEMNMKMQQYITF